MNESKQLIIALCGSTIGARKAALEAMQAHFPVCADLTVSGGVRATWRRGDALFDAIDAFKTSACPVALAIVTCREEAESVEMHGGHVVHVEGTPSDDISIERHTLLLTMREEGRGRYTTLTETLDKLKAA
ncbi:hypothetical protein [Aeromonas phage 85AhydR10PP]|nr:hypothetical protein [Aeromonas phage 85AhydR10PP]